MTDTNQTGSTLALATAEQKEEGVIQSFGGFGDFNFEERNIMDGNLGMPKKTNWKASISFTLSTEKSKPYNYAMPA